MSIILSSIIGKNAKHNRWYLRELEHRIIGKIRSILCMSLEAGKIIRFIHGKSIVVFHPSACLVAG